MQFALVIIIMLSKLFNNILWVYLLQGVSFYVEVIDQDSITDDLVDVFIVDLLSSNLVPGADMTAPQNFLGRFGIATIKLSFQLECVSGFFGNDCAATCDVDPFPCMNGGGCVLNVPNAVMCLCMEGFTGMFCENAIEIESNCLGVNCNNGECVEGVRSFSCVCDIGYMGQFCDVEFDGNDSVNVGVIAGAVAGGVLALLAIIIIVLVVLLLVKWRKSRETDPRVLAGESKVTGQASGGKKLLNNLREVYTFFICVHSDTTHNTVPQREATAPEEIPFYDYVRSKLNS